MLRDYFALLSGALVFVSTANAEDSLYRMILLVLTKIPLFMTRPLLAVSSRSLLLMATSPKILQWQTGLLKLGSLAPAQLAYIQQSC